jgi:hypothetical protein
MSELSTRVRALIVVVAVGGLAVLAARMPDATSWDAMDLVTFLMLAAGIVVTEQFQIPLRYGSETLNFSLTEALWVGAMLLARPSVVTLAVGTGLVLGQATRRWAPHKVAFNVGQFLIALAAAQAIFGSLRSSGVTTAWTLCAAGLAMAAYAALNSSLVALVISQASGRPFRSVLVPPLGTNLLHFAGNTALGLAGAVAFTVSAGATLLLVLPVGLAFLAYASLVERLRQTEPLRSAALSRAA